MRPAGNTDVDDVHRSREAQPRSMTVRRPAFWARRLHKWVAWVVGLQALLWMASGLYMTAIDIDTIHGDHLAQADAAPLAGAAAYVDPDDLAARHGGVTAFRLKRLGGREVYELHHAGGVALVDARTGAGFGALDEARIRALATAYYTGIAPVRSIELLEVAPPEVSNRPAPLWQVEFADRHETTLYVSATTGDLLAKRHDLWRWFDVFWMLHIMDYAERSDANNGLLRTASVLGLAFAVTGVWLLFYSFRRRRRA
jgi:hypothetical protein